MSLTWITDEAIEAVVEDEVVADELTPLAWFARHVRMLGDGAAPPASAELEELFWSTESTSTTVAPTRSRSVVGLRRLAKVALGGSVVAASLTSAAAAGVLPDPAADAVRGAVEALTPLDLADRGDEPEPRDNPPTTFGERVSSDATGESDGDPGVDGQQISEEAPGAAHRPDAPGTPDVTGRDRAADTPAAPHVPDQPTSQPPSQPPSTTPEHGPPPSTGAASPSSTVPSTQENG